MDYGVSATAHLSRPLGRGSRCRASWTTAAMGVSLFPMAIVAGRGCPMRVLLVAPPGAGKGTQGAVIAAHFDIPHIATGDLLRDHVARQTDLGRAVRGHL